MDEREKQLARIEKELMELPEGNIDGIHYINVVDYLMSL